MRATGGQSHRLNLTAEAAAAVPREVNISPQRSVLQAGLIPPDLHHPPHDQPSFQAEVIQFTKSSRRSGGMSVFQMGAKMSDEEMNSQ